MLQIVQSEHTEYGLDTQSGKGVDPLAGVPVASVGGEENKSLTERQSDKICSNPNLGLFHVLE